MFRNAIKRDPKFGEAYDKLGDAEMKRGEPVAALSAYRRAVDLLPQADGRDCRQARGHLPLSPTSIGGKKNDALLREADNSRQPVAEEECKFLPRAAFKGLGGRR